MLKDGHPYSVLGLDFFDRMNHDRLIRYFSRRLAELGQKVTVEPLPEVTPGEGMVTLPSPCQTQRHDRPCHY